MAKRAYTASEIDRIRMVCRIKTRADVWQYGYADEIRDKQAKAGAAAEDMVRTYMLGGIDPAELEATIKACPNCSDGMVKAGSGAFLQGCVICGGSGFIPHNYL